MGLLPICMVLIWLALLYVQWVVVVVMPMVTCSWVRLPAMSYVKEKTARGWLESDFAIYF
jgi:hypothetical protein